MRVGCLQPRSQGIGKDTPRSVIVFDSPAADVADQRSTLIKVEPMDSSLLVGSSSPDAASSREPCAQFKVASQKRVSRLGLRGRGFARRVFASGQEAEFRESRVVCNYQAHSVYFLRVLRDRKNLVI